VELERLRRYPHALDYQFTEEQIKFLEDNGYVVLEVSAIISLLIPDPNLFKFSM
jgi:hypothetical protein